MNSAYIATNDSSATLLTKVVVLVLFHVLLFVFLASRFINSTVICLYWLSYQFIAVTNTKHKTLYLLILWTREKFCSFINYKKISKFSHIWYWLVGLLCFTFCTFLFNVVSSNAIKDSPFWKSVWMSLTEYILSLVLSKIFSSDFNLNCYTSFTQLVKVTFWNSTHFGILSVRLSGTISTASSASCILKAN